MENQLKMRISRMFRSSFGSCRTRNMSDVIEKAIFFPQNHRGFQEVEPQAALPSTPKVRPFPSICRPERTSETIHGNSIKSVEDAFPVKKVSDRSSASMWGGLDGWSCPPASPTSPLNPFAHCKEFGFVQETKIKTSGTNKSNEKKKKDKKKVTRMRTRSREFFPFSASSMDSSFRWYSSDNEDDEGVDEVDTLLQILRFL